MTNPIKLNVVNITKNINETVIEVLEETLEKAKTGNVMGVAIAKIHDDGGIGHIYSANNDSSAMLGSIEALKMFYYENAFSKKES